MIEESYGFFKSVTDLRLTEDGNWGLWLSTHHPECNESALWVFIPSKVTDSQCDLKQSFVTQFLQEKPLSHNGAG